MADLMTALRNADAAGDTDAAQRIAAMIQQQTGPSATPVSDDMSTFDKLLAGYGRGVTEIGQGAKQLAEHAGSALGVVDPATTAAYDKAVAGEARLYDRDLGKTTAGKIGDFAGQAITTLPVGGIDGMLAKQGLGMVGKGIAQGAIGGALQPVTGGDYAGEKSSQIGGGAALGGVGSAILGGLLKPSSVVSGVLDTFGAKANASPFAQAGEDLAAQTGVMMTPAQINGSKAGAMAENAARQSIFSRDAAFASDKVRTQQLADYFNRTMDGIARSDASPLTTGNQVRAATRNILGQLTDARSMQAAKDYGAVDALTKGAATIQPTNTNQLLQSLVDQWGGTGSKGGDAITRWANKQLSNVAPATQSGLNDVDQAAISQFGGLANMNGDNLATAEKWSPGITQRLQGATNSTAPAQGNLAKLIKLRSYVSKVAGGQTGISGDPIDRKIGAQLLGTIDQDLDAASASLPGDVGATLKTANQNYRNASQQIDSIHASPLGKILGEDFTGALQSGQFNSIPPELVAERLNNLKPSQISVVRGIMEQQDPDTWALMKRSMLQSAIEKAQEMPASAGANTAFMRPTVLVKNLGDAGKLQAAFDPGELSQINAGLDVARRLGDSTGYNSSGTAAQAEVLHLLDNPMGAAKSAINKGVGGVLQLGTLGLGTKQIANIMANADGRAALMQLNQLSPWSAKARQLTAYLAALGSQQVGTDPNQAQQDQ